jgi:hypothetical protein
MEIGHSLFIKMISLLLYEPEIIRIDAHGIPGQNILKPGIRDFKCSESSRTVVRLPERISFHVSFWGLLSDGLKRKSFLAKFLFMFL